VLGLLFSTSGEPVFTTSQFVLGYFLEIFSFLMFAQLMAFLLKRSGLTIAVVFFYAYAFENILWLVLRARHDIDIFAYMPIGSTRSLIHFPFPRYALYEIQDYVSFQETALVLGYTALFIFLMYRLLKSRDIQ